MTYGLATLVIDGRPQAALVRDERYVPLSRGGEQRDLPALLANWSDVVGTLEDWARDEQAFASAGDLSQAEIRMPYRPGQVFCTGANYRKHVVGLIMGDPSMRTAEHEALSDDERRARIEKMMDERAKAEPYCFVKLPSCAVGPRDEVVLPRNVVKPDWDLELGVVIGKRARHVSGEQAMDH